MFSLPHVTSPDHPIIFHSPKTNLVCPNIAHGLISSHRDFFMTLTCGFWNLNIITNPNHPLRNSQNKIQFFVSLKHINSNVSPLNIKFIKISQDMCGQTCGSSLTPPIMTVNGIKLTQSPIGPSNVIRSFETVQHHMLQNLQHFTLT